MKKVNIEELTGALNQFRMSFQNKTFTREELGEELQKLGFNNGIVSILIPKLFPFEKLGNSRLYQTPKEPIYKSQIKGIYEKIRDERNKSYHSQKEEKEENLSEEKALSLLSARGYQIRKCIGFDLERFQKENPVLYKKYLKYEII